MARGGMGCTKGLQALQSQSRMTYQGNPEQDTREKVLGANKRGKRKGEDPWRKHEACNNQAHVGRQSKAKGRAETAHELSTAFRDAQTRIEDERKDGGDKPDFGCQVEAGPIPTKFRHSEANVNEDSDALGAEK
jgi:hypothetical protein